MAKEGEATEEKLQKREHRIHPFSPFQSIDTAKLYYIGVQVADIATNTRQTTACGLPSSAMANEAEKMVFGLSDDENPKTPIRPDKLFDSLDSVNEDCQQQ